MKGDTHTHTDVTFPAAFIELYHQQVCRCIGRSFRLFFFFRQTFFFSFLFFLLCCVPLPTLTNVFNRCTGTHSTQRQPKKEEESPWIGEKKNFYLQFPYDHLDRDGRHTEPFPFIRRSLSVAYVDLPTKTGLWGWPRRTPKILLTAAAAACLSVFYQFLSGLFFLIFLFSLSFHD
jgi:hypothetical protein